VYFGYDTKERRSTHLCCCWLNLFCIPPEICCLEKNVSVQTDRSPTVERNISHSFSTVHSIYKYQVVRVYGYKSRGPWFDSCFYQIYWEVRGLERGPLSLVRTTEENYLNEKVAAPVYKTEINGCGNSLRWPRNTPHPQKMALISPTSGGRSVGIIRLRITAMEFS
jgi:hypothetical protein